MTTTFLFGFSSLSASCILHSSSVMRFTQNLSEQFAFNTLIDKSLEMLLCASISSILPAYIKLQQDHTELPSVKYQKTPVDTPLNSSLHKTHTGQV